jgi:tRNA pseudouridine13 synthase
MVSVPSQHRICDEIGDIKQGDNWSLTLLGGSSIKVRSGVHDANKFTLKVRDITYEQKQQLPNRVLQFEKHGVPNWFDSQRFGSAIKGVLPGAHIIERDFATAMNLFLAQRSASDRSATRHDKQRIAECWPNLSKIDTSEISHKPLRKPLRAFGRAAKEGANEEESFKAAYLAMPRDLRGMWLSAWQSRCWNQKLAKLLNERFDEHLLHPVRIPTGDILLFPHAPAGRTGIAKHSLVENIATRFTEMPDSLQMQSEDLTDIDGFLAEHDRACIIHPDEFSISEPERDEMNGSGKRKRWKTTLSFALPPGAYATVIIKRLFH